MFDRVTEEAKRVLHFAHGEAYRLDHRTIGPEHLLLGIAMEGKCPAAAILKKAVPDLDGIVADVEAAAPRGPKTIRMGLFPFTNGAKHVLELASVEARMMGRGCVGTGQLLLGLLRFGEEPERFERLEERAGLASQVLRRRGLELERVREAVRDFPTAEKPADTEPEEPEVGALERRLFGDSPPPDPPIAGPVVQWALILLPIAATFWLLWYIRPIFEKILDALGGVSHAPFYTRIAFFATEPFRFTVLAAVVVLLAIVARRRKDGGWMFLAILYAACLLFVCVCLCAMLRPIVYIQT